MVLRDRHNHGAPAPVLVEQPVVKVWRRTVECSQTLTTGCYPVSVGVSVIRSGIVDLVRPRLTLRH